MFGIRSLKDDSSGFASSRGVYEHEIPVECELIIERGLGIP